MIGRDKTALRPAQRLKSFALLVFPNSLAFLALAPAVLYITITTNYTHHTSPS